MSKGRKKVEKFAVGLIIISDDSDVEGSENHQSDDDEVIFVSETGPNENGKHFLRHSGNRCNHF